MQISSCFDSGAIEVVRLDDPADIRLRLRKDNAADFHQWFHFRLTGAAGTPVIKEGPDGIVFYTLFFGGDRLLRVYGPIAEGSDVMVEIVMDEAPLRKAMRMASGLPLRSRWSPQIPLSAATKASRSGEALAALKPLFPYFTAASSVLQTGLENLNLIVHPAMVLPNVGAMERAKLEGRVFGFYQNGVVPAAGVLGDALDAERKRVCEAYGVEHTSMAKAIDQYYGFKSNTFYEAMQNPVYKSFPPFQPDIWREWELVDLPYAIVPCVQLAEQAGIAVPLHRAQHHLH